MAEVTDRSSEYWRDVPGYEGKYQASRSGEIRRIYSRGAVRCLKSTYKSGNHRRLIRLTDVAGNRKEYSVHAIVALAFGKVPPSGYVLYHKNGNLEDNSVDNLGFITRRELGKMTAAKANKKKSVFKVNAAGEVVEVYRSARAAGKENNFSYQAVIDRCHGKIKDPFRWADFTFRYE